jgi:hypothetical protein
MIKQAREVVDFLRPQLDEEEIEALARKSISTRLVGRAEPRFQRTKGRK